MENKKRLDPESEAAMEVVNMEEKMMRKKKKKSDFRDRLNPLEKNILAFGEQQDWNAIFRIFSNILRFAPANELVEAYVDAGWSSDQIRHYFADWQQSILNFFTAIEQVINDREADYDK